MLFLHDLPEFLRLIAVEKSPHPDCAAAGKLRLNERFELFGKVMRHNRHSWSGYPRTLLRTLPSGAGANDTMRLGQVGMSSIFACGAVPAKRGI